MSQKTRKDVQKLQVDIAKNKFALRRLNALAEDLKAAAEKVRDDYHLPTTRATNSK
jgi:hypothetical protein